MHGLKINFAVPNIYRTFAVAIINNMETATAYTNSTETIRIPRTRRVTSKQIDVSKTPESELMSVDEYFGMVWDRYLEKYEKLHS